MGGRRQTQLDSSSEGEPGVAKVGVDDHRSRKMDTDIGAATQDAESNGSKVKIGRDSELPLRVFNGNFPTTRLL
jgi:hypothetical protein